MLSYVESLCRNIQNWSYKPKETTSHMCNRNFCANFTTEVAIENTFEDGMDANKNRWI